ncbi:MAG: hypothetical protein M3395_10995, partial [Chloroflexota bacterium]|nr:hypothetical protein [Chloroflexota bacterium]
AIPRPMAVLVAETSADDEGARERRLALDDVLAMRAARGLPAAEVSRFTRAAHNLMRYRPDEVAGSLLALLRRAASAPPTPATSGDRQGGPA